MSATPILSSCDQSKFMFYSKIAKIKKYLSNVAFIASN